MKITVMAVGKIKEKWYQQAIAEFSKRMQSYCKLEIVETADEKIPKNAGSTMEEIIKQREGERIEKRLADNTYLIALDVKGKMSDSPGFSKHLETLFQQGNSHITFLIGGALGLDAAILKRADERISFSEMTFPHSLMRVILLEQVYRAYRIMNGEPYHK